MSESATAEPNRLIAASVGVAIPRDRNQFGYLSEHHSYGENEKVAGDYAEDLAAEMLATVLGIKFDPDSAWDEKRELWKLADVITQTKQLTASATTSGPPATTAQCRACRGRGRRGLESSRSSSSTLLHAR